VIPGLLIRTLAVAAVVFSASILGHSGTALGGTHRVFTAGKSVQDRAIRVQRHGDPSAPFKALIVGSIHGDEPEGMRVVRRLDRLAELGIKSVDLWTIRTVNPDGIARGSRGNSRGVDLNRNFPHRFDPTLNGGYESGPEPLSEPESRTIARIAWGRNFDLSIWYHQPWGRTLVPCGPTARFARRYARLSGLEAEPGCDRPYPGSVSDWMRHRFGTRAFVVELGAGRPARPEVDRHARAAIRLIKSMR